MKNYKLINLETKQEVLCDKITVDGFDYYVSDDKPKLGEFYIDDTNQIRQAVTDDEEYWDRRSGYKIIIATTNPNIDIPKVVCNIDLTKLCYYDRRNPDFSIKEEYGYDKEEVEATGNFAKKDCGCDNCFYGRSALTEQLIKSQETHPFSEEDLIEFAEWVDNMGYRQVANGLYKSINDEKGKLTKELLQLWKEQKPKIVYYESN